MPRSSRKPDQLAPDVSSDGYQIVLPKELTVDHSHCRVARTGFWAGFLTLPGGRTTLGRTWIAEGQLVDDRDPVVRRYHRNLRKPRAADRVA